MKTAIVTTILLFLFQGLSECQDTFSSYDIAELMRSGRQMERIEGLDYKKVCKCQCTNLLVYNKLTKCFEGNCKTSIDGRAWCYVSDEAARYCRHAEIGPNNFLKFSFDACYTPAPGEGPCSSDQARAIEMEPKRNLSCCAVHYGKPPTDPAKFDPLVGIKTPCYVANDVEPDEGCEKPIEATWGPAKPCRCIGIDFVKGDRVLTPDTFVHCGVGVASGHRIVDVEGASATAGVSTIQQNGSWKRRGNCQWRRSPSKSGPWRCE